MSVHQITPLEFRLADNAMISWLDVYDPEHFDLFTAPSCLPVVDREELVYTFSDIDFNPDCNEEMSVKFDAVYAAANRGDKLAERLIYLRAYLEWSWSEEVSWPQASEYSKEKAQLISEYVAQARQTRRETAGMTLRQIDKSLEKIGNWLLRSGDFIARPLEDGGQVSK